ncbi:acetolactate synthase [Skeletonema marinoi]|uniref:Acetolactate synthase n=1 Tax=Skeletonema marinoi TaxID=267567 RepID=A0AAD8Y9W0_9STRA|nr:acetolactate synthase [Skeletonema marinoi]
MKFATAAAILAATSSIASTGAFTLSQHRSNIAVYERRKQQNNAFDRSSPALMSTMESKSVGNKSGFNSQDGLSSAAWDDLVNGSAELASKNAARTYMNKFKGDTAAHIIYSKLLEHGVEVVNGYSGGAILPLLDQFHNSHPRHGEDKRIRWITNSNESSAGHVAEGIAKSSTEADGRLAAGIVVATSGPGATNLVTPIVDAMCDGVPLIVLCGQAATTAPVDAFQSCPAVDIMKPCSKWSYQIKSAAEVPFAMDYAFYVARNGRPGPVFIDLPKDLQVQQLTDEVIENFLDGVGTYTQDEEYNLQNDKEFVRLIPDTTAIHLGRVEEGLSFVVDKEGELKHVESGHDAYHLDHHSTNTIYAGVDYEKIYEEEDGRRTGKLSASDGLMAEMMGLIQNAKRPFIIAGQGTNDASPELREFAESLQIPVATTLHGLGVFDERHHLATNMLGMHGHATPNYLIQECDLLICIGSRFDDRITGRVSDFIPAARQASKEGRGGVIHVDVRFSENNKQIYPDYFVHSTGKKFLQTVNDVIRMNPPKDASRTKAWIEKKLELEKEYPINITRYNPQKFMIEDEDGNTHEVTRTKMNCQSVIHEMNRQLLESGKIDNSIFTTGVGIHQMAAAQLITWTQPRQMLSSGSLGTMGVSLGYCMGAKLANPTKICISVDGDGSFNMTFTELKTIGEEKIPVKLLILDNESQMMVEYWQRLFHDERYIAVRNKSPKYCTLAAAFDIKSLYCESMEELPEMMRSFLEDYDDEPVLFHVRIERTPCLPMVAPGQPLDNMILVDEDFEVDKSAAPS